MNLTTILGLSVVGSIIAAVVNVVGMLFSRKTSLMSKKLDVTFDYLAKKISKLDEIQAQVDEIRIFGEKGLPKSLSAGKEEGFEDQISGILETFFKVRDIFLKNQFLFHKSFRNDFEKRIGELNSVLADGVGAHFYEIEKKQSREKTDKFFEQIPDCLGTYYILNSAIDAEREYCYDLLNSFVFEEFGQPRHSLKSITNDIKKL